MVALLAAAFQHLAYAVRMKDRVFQGLGNGVFEFGGAIVVEQLHQFGGDTRQWGAAVGGLLQERATRRCGLCQSVAGPQSIKVMKTAVGSERPVVVGTLDHETVDRIYDTCPGTRIDGLPERLIAEGTRIDNVWGPWRRIVRSWASDPDVRFEGSTGGVLSALASYLLSSKRVDFILHAKAASYEPTFGERHLSFVHADVMEGAGSRYGPTAPLVDVDTVLERGRPFAFVGKPCDIGALRNLARHDKRVGELCKVMLTPVCGGYMEPQGMRKFLAAQGIDEREVTRFDPTR